MLSRIGRTRAFLAVLLCALIGLAGCGAAGGSSAGGGSSAQIGVTPLSDFLASGIVGGSFAPASKVYTVTNLGSSNVDWTAGSPSTWLSIDQTSGTLLPGDSVDVTVSIDQAAAISLATGVYASSVAFHDALAGDVAVLATLTVNDPPVIPPDTMSTASRTTGVAPLLVVFDAVDTASPSWTSGVAQPANGDFGSFQHSWNFGDLSGGTWPFSGRPQNEDTGYVAAHVFEQPGTYEVTLHVLTAADQDMAYTQNITVLPFTGTTYYVSSSSGNNGNSGTSQGSPLATFDAGIAKSASNVRILFKRGDSFPTAGIRTINSIGPGIVGAYGTGANPVVLTSTATNADSTLTVRGNDWRITDLNFVGAGVGGDDTGRSISIGTTGGNKVQNFLALRVGATGYGTGIEWPDAWIGGNVPDFQENIGIVDCHLHDLDQYGMYVGGLHLAVLGNRVENITPTGEHILRIWHMHKSLVSHNYLSTPGNNKHVIKLHNAMAYGAPAAKDGEYIHIADNDIRGVSQWSVAIGPQHAQADERIRQVVYERNRSQNSGIDLMIWARKVTVRNNVFNGSITQLNPTAVWIGRRGIEPASDDVRVFNNTVYQAGHPSVIFNPFYVEPVVTTITIENNLVCMPNSGVPIQMVGGTPSVGVNNVIATSGDFVNAAFGDFHLAPGSIAVDVAIALKEVREDFARALRPLLPDLGALEQ
ncbi:MAG TPA: PKD domain-containing protein [Planctomycetota bacterium]|nr:PKD domain-containing protein [Planctomycetota bacterium]